MSKPDPTITFPTPSTDWGTVTHCWMPNPAWRWWAFWRPRAIVIDMPPTRIEGKLFGPGDTVLPQQITIHEA
jgi:hypothetical protein